MDDFVSLIQASKPTLVIFYAQWHKPSFQLFSTLNRIQTKFSSKVNLFFINAEEKIEITKKYKIIQLPTVILFKESKIIWRSTSILTEENLLNEIQNTLF
jgi:thioredoxin 1